MELNTETVNTKLYYDQEVFFLVNFCSPNVKSYSPDVLKLGKLKGFKDGKYLVQAISPSTKINNVRVVVDEGDYPGICTTVSSNESVLNCPCVKTPIIYEVEPNNLFVLNILGRELPYENSYGSFLLKAGLIIKVYPKSEDYKILAFNNDLTKMIVIDANKELETDINLSNMKVVDLEKDIVVTNIINPTIDYEYLKVIE